MIFSNLLTHGREKIGTRIFYFFAVTIVVIYSSFVAFFVYHEKNTLEKNLIHEGKELSNILAYNSRLGVLTENTRLLRDPIEAIIQNRDAVLVQIFTLDGNLLTSKYKNIAFDARNVKELFKMQSKDMEIVKKSTTSYSKYNDYIEFRTTVISKPIFSEENLYFNEASSNNEIKITGFTRIVFTTKFMKGRLWDIVLRSLFIPIIFMIPVFITSYFIIKSITKPLRMLTDQVKALGAGENIKKLDIKINDEVGKLADAFNNMTESLKNREEEKQQLEEKLRHAHKMEAIGTFAGGIAHDFNNILCTTIGFGDLLKKKIKDDPISCRYVENIISSAKKGDTLVKNLLVYGRKQIVCLEPVNINTFLCNTEEFISKVLNESIKLIIELPKENLNILADHPQLERVLMNLATNARDAMPDGGSLTIGAKKIKKSELNFSIPEKVPNKKNGDINSFTNESDDSYFVEISVADTGTGIDSKTKERMFDPFFTTKKTGKGTGLGLSIVFGIIEQHNGSIEVTSEPGKGSMFKILLPLLG